METNVIASSVTVLYATITAMPAGNLIAAAPGANKSLRIDAVYACAMTTTTNQEIAFGPTTTALGIRRIAATRGDTVQWRLGDGWLQDTNTSFGVWLNTTGAVGVTVEYSIVQRG